MTVRRGWNFEMKVHGYAAYSGTDIHFASKHGRVTTYPFED
ncbi:hypothetical protein ACO0K9_23620 [Undibacterium sp. Ji50W]